MTATDSPAPSPTPATQQLVLLGAGLAHLQLLAQLATQAIAHTEVTLVAPQPRPVYPGMLPGFVAGHYALEDTSIALEPLVQRSGIRWVQRSVVAMDAQQQRLRLDDGSTLSYDWLSVNTSPVQDRDQLEQALPGSREHGMFLRPMEAFCALWPRVVDMGSSRPLRIAVIGAGAGSIELALAARRRLPNAAVTLVCGSAPLLSHFPGGLQQRLSAVLKRHNVTVLQDTALAITTAGIQLGCGAELACDVPLLTTGAQPPRWLADSGLTLDDHGFVAVDGHLRSTSHSRVFAVGDVGTRASRSSIRTGQVLATNLAAAISGLATKPHPAPATSLLLLACGGKYAVGSWRGLGAQGRWVWWLKNWLDRRFVARFAAPTR